jgi:hypothetical protein
MPPCVGMMLGRIQVSNVPVRNCCPAGVRIPPTVLMRLYMRNAEKLSLRHAQGMAGKP